MIFERLTEIKPSPIRKMFEKADENSINLGLGMPFLKTQKRVKAKAINAIKNDKTFYTPTQGLNELRKVVSARFDSHLNLDERNVLVTNGATQAIFALMFSLLGPKDTVLVPDPGYPLYEAIAKMLKCNVEKYTLALEKNFTPNIDEISEKIGDKTTLIVLNSPQNPTGSVIREKTLKEFAAMIEEKENVFVLSDEVYAGLTYEGMVPSASSFLPLERAYIVSGVSKEFSMTGWRIGWLVSSRWNVSQVLKAHTYMVSCISGINQVAALEALKSHTSFVKDAMKVNRSLTIEKLAKIPHIKYKIPAGGIYVFVDVSAYGDGESVANALLESENVITIPGTAFGKMGKKFIRVSFGTEFENLKEGLEAMGRFFSHAQIT